MNFAADFERVSDYFSLSKESRTTAYKSAFSSGKVTLRAERIYRAIAASLRPHYPSGLAHRLN